MATLVAGGEIKCRRPRIDTPYKTLKNLLATHSAGERERRGREMEGWREAAWLLALCCAKPKLRYKLRVRGLGNVTEVAWTGSGTAQPTL